MDPRLRKVYFPDGGYGSMHEVRIFADASIQSSINNALKSLRPERNGAVLDVRMSDGSVAAVMAAKLGKHWSMGLVVEKERGMPTDLGARVAFEW